MFFTFFPHLTVNLLLELMESLLLLRNNNSALCKTGNLTAIGHIITITQF
jgi:hypothetical protein